MEPQGESNPAEEQRLIDAFNELSSRLDKTSEDPLVDSLVACASLPNDATTWRKALSLAGVSNNSVRTGVQAAVAMAVATWMHFTTWTYNAFNGQTLWIAITVAVVAQKTAGMAIRKGLMRIAGTLLGTLLALVLVMAAYVMVPFINPEDVNTALCWVFGIYVPLMVFFTSIARLTSSKYAYMWNVGGYTLPLLALPAEHKLALGRLDKVHDMMIGRIIAILAGNIIVALTSTLILPVTSHRLIATNIDTALKRLGNLLATTMSAYAAVAAHAASSKPADAALPTEAASAIEGPSAATAPTTATLDPPQQPPDPVAAAQRLAEVLEAQGKVEQSLRGANAQIVPAQREWSFPAMRFAHWMEAQRSRHRRGGSGGLQGSLSRTLLDAEGDSRGDEGGSVRMVVSFGVPFPVKGLQATIAALRRSHLVGVALGYTANSASPASVGPDLPRDFAVHTIGPGSIFVGKTAASPPASNPPSRQMSSDRCTPRPPPVPSRPLPAPTAPQTSSRALAHLAMSHSFKSFKSREAPWPFSPVATPVLAPETLSTSWPPQPAGGNEAAAAWAGDACETSAGARPRSHGVLGIEVVARGVFGMLERSLTMVGEGQKAMCMAMVGVLSGEKSLEEARGAERALEDRMGMLRDVDSMVAMAIDRADKMDLSEVEGSVMDTLSQSAAMLGAVWSPAVAIFAALREALKSLASVCEEAPATPTV